MLYGINGRRCDLWPSSHRKPEFVFPDVLSRDCSVELSSWAFARFTALRDYASLIRFVDHKSMYDVKIAYRSPTPVAPRTPGLSPPPLPIFRR